MDDNKFLPILSQNLLEILSEEDYCDIIIEVGNDSHVKSFRAHMNILNHRSPYLKKILSTNKKKNGETLVHLKLPNISPEVFQIILRYIYGGKIPLKEYEASDIIKVLVAAEELNIQELIPYLQSFLIQNQSTWMEQNFNLIFQMSFENDSFMEFQTFCTELISKVPDKIFKSPDFNSISEKSLISLIKNDNLQLDEVQIWEHVLKWGFAQNPKLSLDNLENFSKDDFNTLKNTLQRCIPLIRFHNLTLREFSDKVVPYKKIFPKELYKELLKDFLDSDSKPINNKSKPRTIEKVKEIQDSNIDSKIITNQHAELISKWIDRLEDTDKKKNSYGFKLILRGSRDGFTPEKFHEICDNESQTVSIIKVKSSNEILGGYNPIEWKSDQRIFSFGTNKDCFIFSFKNKENIKDCILSRVMVERCAVRYWSSYGPSFGNGDLKIYKDTDAKGVKGVGFYNHSSCKSKSYEKPIRKTDKDFSVEEYEVFQIIKIDD